jgi:hypothetical protein
MAIYALIVFVAGWGTHGAYLRSGTANSGGMVSTVLNLPIAAVESLLAGIDWIVTNAVALARGLMELAEIILRLF